MRSHRTLVDVKRTPAVLGPFASPWLPLRSAHGPSGCALRRAQGCGSGQVSVLGSPVHRSSFSIQHSAFTFLGAQVLRCQVSGLGSRFSVPSLPLRFAQGCGSGLRLRAAAQGCGSGQVPVLGSRFFVLGSLFFVLYSLVLGSFLGYLLENVAREEPTGQQREHERSAAVEQRHSPGTDQPP